MFGRRMSLIYSLRTFTYTGDTWLAAYLPTWLFAWLFIYLFIFARFFSSI